MRVRAFKYDRRPYMEWQGETVYRSPSGIVFLSPPGTVCLHHSKGIRFQIEHYSLSVVPHDAWFNAMVDFNTDG